MNVHHSSKILLVKVLKYFRRLRNMWLNILQLHDQDLFDHLEALSVLPTTFGMNWTKLLFSRQFKAYLSMWDAILASRFYLVDYIVVAMVRKTSPSWSMCSSLTAKFDKFILKIRKATQCRCPPV